MLRWICGVSTMDRIRSETITGKTKVGEISKKIQERRLKWYGHVMRRDEEYDWGGGMDVEGKRKGRLKQRLMDTAVSFTCGTSARYDTGWTGGQQQRLVMPM